MIIARLPHYEDHLRPVAALLPDLPDVALVASYGDVRDAMRHGFERIVLMQHGIGQSYSNRNPHYPGGESNEAVGLFLVPNDHSADRWRAAYPRAAVEVVGSPRIDSLPAREPGPFTIAVSFHWDAFIAPEARSTFDFYKQALPELAQRYNLIGHSHPRFGSPARFYAKHGIEFVPTFDEVCRCADLYICDNSSTIYEFASTGRPVVVLNGPFYRREVEHGLRFWEAADVGRQVWESDDLIGAVEDAVADRGQIAREAALDIVYPIRWGGAQLAATAIRGWLGRSVTVAA